MSDVPSHAEAARRYPLDLDGWNRDRNAQGNNGFRAGAAWAVERAAAEADRGYLASENCDDIAARIRALVSHPMGSEDDRG